MKVLANSGYKIPKEDLSPETLLEVEKDLTVSPNTGGGFGDPHKKAPSFPVYRESSTKLYLPRFYGQDKFGLPDETRFNPRSIATPFKGALRKEQEPIVQLYLDAAKDKGGGIICLKCGGGKTVLALYIASVLSLKTIVLVHKDFLMTQWRDRILEFLPGAKIGKVQQGTVDIEGKDIVLAMVQSISMKDYPKDTFSSFGLSIFDECHHLGAEVFHRSMGKVATKYSLGLSATPQRKDGLRRVFEWYIGPTVYVSKEKNEDYIEVRIHEYTHESKSYNKAELLYNGKPCFARMINNVCSFVPRQEFINNLVIQEHRLGRKILVLSDRREHLDLSMDYLNERIHEGVAGLYVGGMKPHQLRESQEKDIILGTFSMASEGMDIPKLNTIVLASPKSDVIQSVGRILREKAGKRKFHPLVIDIKDCHPNLRSFQNQCDKRIKFYHRQNYEVTSFSMEGQKTRVEKKKGGRKPKEIPGYEMECLLEED
jgi:superfamily II DNA or RNA helicase